MKVSVALASMSVNRQEATQAQPRQGLTESWVESSDLDLGSEEALMQKGSVIEQLWKEEWGGHEAATSQSSGLALVRPRPN